MKKFTIELMCVALFVLCAPSKQFAQNESKPKLKTDYKVSVRDNKAVDIQFDAEKNITNILIIVVDSMGNTLFLDNQHDFKGSYKCSIDMTMYMKGNYYVKISSDGEETQKTLNIH